MTNPTGYLVMCVHSTRGTRRDAPTACETRCTNCGATVLINRLTLAHGQARGVPLYPLCPGCTIAIANPAETVADAELVPGTVEYLEQGGIPDGAAHIAEGQRLTIREFAHNALRNTIGGQG